MKQISMISLAVSLLCVTLLGGCDSFTSTDTRIERAEQDLQQGDYQAAMAEIKKALEKEPENAKARLILAKASLLLGDANTAATELQRAEDGGVDVALTRPLKVDSLLLQGRTDEAAKVLQDSPAVTGTERDLREGRILLAQSDPKAAEAKFEVAASAGSLEGRLGKVEALSGQGRLDEAQAEIDRILVEHPESGAAWLAQGSLQARSGKFTDAAQSLAKAIEHSAALSQPQRIQAHAARVEVLISAGDLDGAGRAQADLEKIAGGAAVPLLTGARLALARGEPKLAVERLQRVAQGMPNQPDVRALLVSALMAEGSLEQALSVAGSFVGDFPESDLARLTLAQVQVRTGHSEEANETLRPLIDRPIPSPRALAMAAQIEMRQGRGASGLDYLERGIETSPDNVPLQIELALAYVASSRAEEAVKLLRAIPDGQYSTQRDRLLIIAIAATRDRKGALAEIDRAIRANPEDVALLNLSASYYTSIGDAEGARKLLQKALAVNPGDAGSLLALARLDFTAGDFGNARKGVQTVLQAEPANIGALGLMADIARQEGNAAEVERWLEEARRADPQALMPRVQLANLAIARGDMDRFDLLVNELDRVAADKAPVQSAIGALMGQANRGQQAVQRFRRAVELDPKLPEPHVGLGRIYQADGKVEEARREFGRALELRPGWMLAAAPLAMLEVADKRVDAALRVVSDAKQRAPQSAAPWVLEGDVRFAAGQPAAAADAYEAALEREPSALTAAKSVGARRAAGIDNPERPLVNYVTRHPSEFRARAALANIYLTSGQFDAAILEYETVVKAVPKDAISLNNLAWLYSQKNDPRSTETAAKAYEIAPQLASVADTYAWILVQGGDVKRGLEILSQVADKAAKNTEIQYHYAFALNAAGQPDKAREVLKAALAQPGRSSARSQAEALLKELGG